MSSACTWTKRSGNSGVTWHCGRHYSSRSPITWRLRPCGWCAPASC
ncbi:hypothetical protein I4I83_18615 [Acidovorax cattleyae]|nr:hypothetical protein [Paracidovorax cattleyae]